MLGFDKTVKLCIIEYAIYFVLHVFYAFYMLGSGTGRLVLLYSAIAFSFTVVLSYIFNKRTSILIVLVVSQLLSASVLGLLCKNAGLAPFIFIIAAIALANFNEPKAITIFGLASFIMLFIYSFVFKAQILLFFPSIVLYYLLILVYVCALINLAIFSINAKETMLGLKVKTEEAERANESKMTFLSNMSHEIRTPMNAIYGIAELTLREPDISDTVRENTENIQKASRVLISIVNDIIDYSKMEDGKMEIIPVTYSLRNLINDTVNMMKIRMDDNDLEIRVDIQNDLPDVLVGDEIRIRQVLFNLLSNSIRYTEKGYIIVQVSGTIIEGFLKLEVSVLDSGIGIKKDELSKLFTSFQQINSRKTRRNESTGLGLVICKELVAMMDGNISVESTYGVGSKFTFDLLQKISDDNTMLSYSKDLESKTDERISAPDGKVLLVDDNAVNLKVCKGLMRTFGLTVDTATSGKEALEILKTTRDYDILFIDHMMPELDGIDTLNLIRADSNEYMRKVPIVVLTANVASGVRETLLAEGFDEYVPKPIDMVWLNRVLCKLLPKDKIR